MKYLLLTFIVMASAFSSCKSPSSSELPEQGVKGQLYWLEGNQMPGPGKDTDKRLPVKRKVYICQALTSQQMQGRQPLFESLPEDEIVEVVKSDVKGVFVAELPAGTYSIFTEEEEGFFANRMNGQGVLNPLVVEQDKLTETEIVINYKAVF